MKQPYLNKMYIDIIIEQSENKYTFESCLKGK